MQRKQGRYYSQEGKAADKKCLISGKLHWFQVEKEYLKASPLLFNLYAEYITRYAGLDEAQTGIKIAGRNINNFRYADDTTLMAESEEELKNLLMKVKEESEKGASENLRWCGVWKWQ